MLCNARLAQEKCVLVGVIVQVKSNGIESHAIGWMKAKASGVVLEEKDQVELARRENARLVDAADRLLHESGQRTYHSAQHSTAQ